MAGPDPSAQTTLLILLGASNWSHHPELPGSTAFEGAVRDLRAYFLSDPNGFHLPKGNVLDLFNSDELGPALLNRISVFLKEHKESSIGVRDVLVYFVGHGGISGDSSTFYLAIRQTEKDYEKGTSITIDDLAERLKKGARFQRRILIIDCCFAAQAVKFFQGPAPTVLLRKKMTAAFEENDQRKGFPSRGTSFLCSSGKDAASVLLPEETSTMFTAALLSALRTGDPFQERDWLSLRIVHSLTIDVLSKTYKDAFPWPELHSPDQSEGDVADIPFFPNHRAEEESCRQREEVEPMHIAFAGSRPPEATTPKPTSPISQLPPGEPVPSVKPQRHISRRVVVTTGLVVLTGASVLGTLAWQTRSRKPQISPAAATSTTIAQSTMVASATMYARAAAINGVMFGFNAQHTHNNPYERMLNPATVPGLKKKWTYRADSSFGNSSPAVTDGVVYIGSWNGRLYAIDATSGNQKWVYQTGSHITSSPAVADGVVYIGSWDFNLYAIDAASGIKKWAYQTGSYILSSPTVADGVVYIGSWDSKLHAVDATSGTKKWVYQTGSHITSSAATMGSVVYIGSQDFSLYAIDANSGTKKWDYQTRHNIDYSSPAVVSDVVYIGSQDSNLYAIDTFSGTKKWAYQTGSYIDSSPAVADGVVYIGSVKDHTLYAIDAVTGTKKWDYQTGGDIESSPTLAGGVVYISSRDHTLYAIDAVTGTKKWDYQTGGSTDSSPAVADGVIYAGSSDQNLYAFDL